MLVAPRALIVLIFVVLSQPLAASEGACVNPSATDGQSVQQCSGEGDASKKPSSDRSGFDPFEPAFDHFDSCSVERESSGVGRVAMPCEPLA